MKRRHIAAIGERVLIAPFAFDFPGIIVQRPGLADQVEANIGQRQFLFEQWCMSTIPTALTEDQRVVRLETST